MKLETQIRRFMLLFPALYQSRAEALEQLYLVLGNGARWVNGSLVTGLERRKLPKQVNKKLTNEEKRDREIRQRRNMKISYYPIEAQYNGFIISSIPDDVKDDYLAGAFEALKLILICPDNIPKEHAYQRALKSSMMTSSEIREFSNAQRHSCAPLVMTARQDARSKNRFEALKIMKSLVQRFPTRSPDWAKNHPCFKVHPNLLRSWAYQARVKYN